MEFLLEAVNSFGVRSGKLALKSNSFSTPFFLLPTRGGSVPHVTQDVLENYSNVNFPKAVQIPLPTVYETPGTEVLQHYGHGLHKFANLERYFMFLSIQDEATPPRPGYNEEKSVSIWTGSGRHKVNVKDYMDFVKASQVDCFESLCDTPPTEETAAKKVKKSVDRTVRFLDESLLLLKDFDQQLNIFGAIEGGDIKDERRRSAIETSQRPVAGFVIEGVNQKLAKQSVRVITMAATNSLPVNKLRILPGVGSPEDIFTAIESGIDVFDGSYPHVCTARGHAIHWSTEGSLANDLDPQLGCFIDLNCEKFSDDLTPLLAGCSCYTCTKFTRSYVHHLLATRELLASVLLMIHNLYQYSTFFDLLRSALKNDNYRQFKSLYVPMT